jgi:uncharacterized protein
MTTIAAQFADSAIGAYQRYLSPYKGFCCAYRAHTGKRSCSAYGRSVVQKLGLLALVAALPKQFERCQQAFASLKVSEKNRGNNKKSRSNQSCDVPCDAACDLPCDCSF